MKRTTGSKAGPRLFWWPMSLKANEPGVWEYLALQAVDDMEFKDLRKISADPWEDIRQGRYEALARVEIDRLGLTLAAGEQPSREA
jgi:hypothetical protein